MNLRPLTQPIALAFLLAALVTGCALQDDLVVVNDRLISLERKFEKQGQKTQEELSQYQQGSVQQEEDYRTRLAELHTSVDELKEEIQNLRGGLEETRHELQQKLQPVSAGDNKLKEAEQSLRSMQERIVRLEQYMGMEPSEQLSSSRPSQGGEVAEKPGGPNGAEDLYGAAKREFDQGNYDKARELFDKLLKEKPGSENADNAQFWVGEIYYREKWYEKAILEYQKVIEKYPKGNKVHSALLKQGFAFLNLGDKDNARLIWKELIRQYPKSQEAEIARKRLEAP